MAFRTEKLGECGQTAMNEWRAESSKKTSLSGAGVRNLCTIFKRNPSVEPLFLFRRGPGRGPEEGAPRRWRGVFLFRENLAEGRDGAGGGPLTEKSKTLRPAAAAPVQAAGAGQRRQARTVAPGSRGYSSYRARGA